MTRLGQHFLKNRSVLTRIVDALELRDGDVVIEIGAGHGELTQAISEKAAVKIIAIEKDEKLAAALRGRFSGKLAKEMEIIEGDALEALPRVAAKQNEIKIAGNIPYYITGKLLRAMSELAQKPTRSVLMVQREVAERMCASAPHMNRLAASVQFWAAAKIIVSVPKGDFSPPPEVDSAVVLLEAKNAQPEDNERYYRAVRGVFAQPRKTILNNIVAATEAATKKEHEKPAIEAAMEQLGLDPGARPQNLSIEQIQGIAQAFF